MKARFDQLKDAKPTEPLSVPRGDISKFHNDVFWNNGVPEHQQLFGGDMWDKIPFSRYIYDWCGGGASCSD